MMNEYAGKYRIDINGNNYTLVYDWDALANIEGLCGLKAIQTLFTSINTGLLAQMLEIGLRRHHPEMTVDKLKELSPPYMPCVQAVDKALALAYYGVDTVKPEKKTLLKKILKTI